MYDRMLNKQDKPSIDQLLAHCGGTEELFEMLNSFLSNNYNTTQELRFPYGKDYGWSITHRKGKKLICDIFAEVEAFTVMLRLSDEQFDQVYDSLQPYAKEYVDNKYPCSDGGWIHYRVLCKEHLEDIEKMLSAKC